MQLIQISDPVYYIKNTTNIGVIIKDKKAILIDSGLDDATGKKVLQILQSNEIKPVALINTHSHADHCGANSFLKEKAEIKIYASEIETPTIEYPYFEPFFLFSGANPIKDLKNKFLMAKPSRVDYVIQNQEKELHIEGMKLSIVSLPGHSLNQIGIAVDGILFCADVIFSIDVLNKHKLPFCMDVDKQLETLNEVRNYSYTCYIPSHGNPVDSITDMVNAYIDTISRVKHDLCELLSSPKTTEQLFNQLCQRYEISVTSVQQYYLLQTVTKAYISSLYQEGAITCFMEKNHLLWKKG